LIKKKEHMINPFFKDLKAVMKGIKMAIDN
jgi:hypothetical protein